MTVEGFTYLGRFTKPKFAIRNPKSEIQLGSTCYVSGLRANADDFALFDKKGHTHNDAGFQSGLLGRAPGRGIATHPQLSGDNSEFNVLRQLQRNRSAVVFQDLERQTLFEIAAIAADFFGGKGKLFVSFLVHEMTAFGITVEKRRGRELDIGFLKLL